MKISILAAIGSQNLGDELILKNVLKYFKNKCGKDTNFSVFTYDKKNPFIVGKNIKYYEYFPCGLSKIKNIFKNIFNFINFLKIIKESDLIVIGGGGIFFDKETDSRSNPLKQWLFRVQVCKFFNKKICFHGVGISIVKKSNLSLIKKIFSGKNIEITVRDKYSKKLLTGLDIKSQIIADPVFGDNGNTKKALEKNYCLDYMNPEQFNLNDIRSYDFKGKTIGLSFRSGYFKKDKKIMKEIIEYIKSKKGNIIFLPTSFHKINKLSNDYIYLKYYAAKYNIAITENMSQTYSYYKKQKVDFVFAMRLHSIILAQTYNIPYIAISYAKKTDEILNIIKVKSK